MCTAGAQGRRNCTASCPAQCVDEPGLTDSLLFIAALPTPASAPAEALKSFHAFSRVVTDSSREAHNLCPIFSGCDSAAAIAATRARAWEGIFVRRRARRSRILTKDSPRCYTWLPRASSVCGADDESAMTAYLGCSPR